MDRRSFLQKASAGTAGIVASVRMPAFMHEPKIKVGLIGCGWYGMVIVNAAFKVGDVEIVAVCDVDSEHLENSAREIAKLQGSLPRKFKDYRELLEIKNLEAVIIGTPPQWHALQFIAACEKGLHIYCEKPLAYDVEEGKAMVKAVEKAGNIVQIGFQRRQSASFQKVRELIENGTTGKIRQIAAQIHYNPGQEDTTIQEPPASLDWDAWCGPAPKLPYRPSIGHKAWRLEKEYGNGHLVDWGIHHIDIIRTVMGMEIPDSIHAEGALDILKGRITTPDTLNVTMNFKECPVLWEHRLWGTGEFDARFNNGIFFYGEKATLFASNDGLMLQPVGRDRQQQIMETPTPDVQEKHVADFIRAVKANDKKLLSCTTEDAWKSTTTVQLAMISYYTGSGVKWDNAQKTIVENETAAKLLARKYRGGYIRPV